MHWEDQESAFLINDRGPCVTFKASLTVLVAGLRSILVYAQNSAVGFVSASVVRR
jgi:hypothetical protein